MSFSVEKFLSKEYDAKNYNCWHFACDVWSSITGQLYSAKQVDDYHTVSQLHERALQMTGAFVTLDKPVNPCFVLMRRQRLSPHIGIMIQGKVLHLNDKGAFFDSFDHATACFPEVTFHAPK